MMNNEYFGNTHPKKITYIFHSFHFYIVNCQAQLQLQLQLQLEMSIALILFFSHPQSTNPPTQPPGIVV